MMRSSFIWMGHPLAAAKPVLGGTSNRKRPISVFPVASRWQSLTRALGLGIGPPDSRSAEGVHPANQANRDESTQSGVKGGSLRPSRK